MGKNTSKMDRDDGDEYPLPCLPVTETILGITEQELVKLSAEERRQRFMSFQDGCFMNISNGKLFSYGAFKQHTIESLTEQVLNIPVVRDTQEYSVATKREPVQLTTLTRVDIGGLQGNLTTKDRAMVQVASNFNCLENPRRGTPINSGCFVDKAYLDTTQGPAAVFGCVASYLFRCHFFGGGQSLGTRTIDLLENVSEYFGHSQNGKLTLTGNEYFLDNEYDIDHAAKRVAIGLHIDCPVLFGRTTKNLIYNGPTKKDVENYEARVPWSYPIVDQVLSASINLGDYGVRDDQMTEDRMTNLNRALVRAAYEGVYLAAILRGRKKLYLTLIGGGSFGNPINLIVDEIQRAHNRWANHPASCLEECIICLFDDGLDVQNALKTKNH